MTRSLDQSMEFSDSRHEGGSSSFANCPLSSSLPAANGSSQGGLVCGFSSDSGEDSLSRSKAVSEVSLSRSSRDPPPGCSSILHSSESFDRPPSPLGSSSPLPVQMIKELLMNERTAERELRLLVKMRGAVSGSESCRPVEQTFAFFATLLESVSEFLCEFERQFIPWYWASFQDEYGVLRCGVDGISDISECLLRSAHNSLPLYAQLLCQLPVFLAAADQCRRSHETFAIRLRCAEEWSECPLPLWWLVTRAASRFCAWPSLLAGVVEKLLLAVEADNSTLNALSATRVCLEKVSRFVEESSRCRQSLYSFATLLQLENDISLPGLLTHPQRRALRVGRVERWTRRGFVSRLLLLFNDRLLFALRCRHRDSALSPFRVQMQLPLKGMMFEEGDAFSATGRSSECVTLYSSDTCVIFASNSREDWLSQIGEAVKAVAKSKMELPALDVNQQMGDAEKTAEECGDAREGEVGQGGTGRQKMSAVDACWHRAGAISFDDWNTATSNMKSGYLLRKLRNSPGWQKLWVVVANFSLFFYKTHQESCPLANLPLLEYSVCIASVADGIDAEHVFKLVYSSHHYFFRAENHFALLRWIHAIRLSTANRRPFDSITALALHL